MQVSPLRITSLAPDRSKIPKEFHHLLPTVECVHAEFDLTGVHSSVANGLRRTLGWEMSVIGLECDQHKTDDPYIGHVIEITITRIRMAPIRQTTPIGAVYCFDVVNNTDRPRDVLFGEMRRIKSGSSSINIEKGMPESSAIPEDECPCEPHIVLLKLDAHKRFACTMKVNSLLTNVRGNGARQLACGVTNIPRDFVPLNTYTGEGESVSTSDITKWTIGFDTNGTDDPVNIIRKACSNIIERLRATRANALNGIRQSGDEWILPIDGTYTISYMIVQQIVKTQTSVTACVAAVDDRNKESMLRLKTTVDPDAIVIGAIDSLSQIYSAISEAVAKRR